MLKYWVNMNLELEEITQLKLCETKLNTFYDKLRSIFQEIFFILPRERLQYIHSRETNN